MSITFQLPPPVPYPSELQSAEAPETKLKDYGFPESVTQAFLDAADECDSVILSREPGKSTTGLIAENHDLKGFLLKAKSCDWGPMAGFLCENPIFNKIGAEQSEKNRKDIDHYLEFIPPDNNTPAKISLPQLGKVKVTHQTVFIQIRISGERVKHFPNDNTPPGPDTFTENWIGKKFGEDFVGIGWCDDFSVLGEFFLLKTVDVWSIFHCRLAVLNSNGKYEFSPPTERSRSAREVVNSGTQDGGKTALNDQQKSELNRCLEQLNGKFPQHNFAWPDTRAGWNSSDCYLVLGIQNLFPVFPVGDRRNAMSGDYDLFSVWPRYPKLGFEKLIRPADKASTEKDTPSPLSRVSYQPVFRVVPGKPLTLQIGKSPSVYVEFVVDFKTLELKEDPTVGNISEAVELVAATVNSLISYNRGQEMPNRAFHSDEGGRPGIDAVDYPIIVILPASLGDQIRRDTTGGRGCRMFVIKNHLEFLTLIILLRKYCYVMLQHGWLMHLLLVLMDKQKLEKERDVPGLADKAKKYIVKILKEQENISTDLTKLTGMMRELLFFNPHAGGSIGQDPLDVLQSTFLQQAVNVPPTDWEMRWNLKEAVRDTKVQVVRPRRRNA